MPRGGKSEPYFAYARRSLERFEPFVVISAVDIPPRTQISRPDIIYIALFVEIGEIIFAQIGILPLRVFHYPRYFFFGFVAARIFRFHDELELAALGYRVGFVHNVVFDGFSVAVRTRKVQITRNVFEFRSLFYAYPRQTSEGLFADEQISRNVVERNYRGDLVRDGESSGFEQIFLRVRILYRIVVGRQRKGREIARKPLAVRQNDGINHVERNDVAFIVFYRSERQIDFLFIRDFSAVFKIAVYNYFVSPFIPFGRTAETRENSRDRQYADKYFFHIRYSLLYANPTLFLYLLMSVLHIPL